MSSAAIASLSAWSFVLAIGIAPIVHTYIRAVEEPDLNSAFGERYITYTNSTARYLQLKRQHLRE